MQTSSGGGMMSGLGGAMATGAAMGVGSAVAHQAINSMMGGGSRSHDSQPQAQQQAPPQDYQQYQYA